MSIAVLSMFMFAVMSGAVEDATFNFVDVDLPVVAKYVSEITGKNFIFDEKFQGKVTIIAPSKLSPKDGFRLFTSVLELKGFTVVPSGVNAFKIIPTSMAKQQGLDVRSSGRSVNESYMARLVQLKHISSEEAVNFIRPVISKDGYISSFGPGNLVLIIDSGLNISKVLAIVDTIDQPSSVEVPEIVFLKHAGAEEVAKMINEGMAQSAPSVKGRIVTAPGSPGKVVSDTRLNAVIIFGPKEVRETMKSLISIIDVPSDDAQGKINVYFLENADAEEMSKVLQGVVKGIEEAKDKAKTVKAVGLRDDQKIVITADKSANALVILASPADYRNIVSVVKKLDKRKRQVYVEAMIVEASIDDLFELGSKWRAIAEHDGDPVVIGGVGIMDPTALQSVVYGLSGASVGGMGNFMDIPITTIGTDGAITTSNLTVPGFSALFSLQEFKGAVDVLSTPQILTSDNEEAEIHVGENVPFVTKRESDPNRDVSVFTDVQREDVGIKLKLTPQIAEGDYVRLSLYQEISSVIQESNADILISVGPSTTKRSTSTSVVVKDKETVVIGGLMQERKEENVVKVPLLGDIPLLGWLFKFKTEKKRKTNLLVFITPHIIRDAADLSALTMEKGSQYARSENIFRPGELLVRFKDDVPDERIEEILKENGMSVINFIDRLGVYVIRISGDIDVNGAVDRMQRLNEVQYAEPNYSIRLNSGNDIGDRKGFGLDWIDSDRNEEY
ncbi:MAG: type II secretion system secretin GspD [Nitrospirota bacterium]|nr:MAG: type II secretion system secretin GspD [Nitrospirota bacterium]